jgi:hypothetical protein
MSTLTAQTIDLYAGEAHILSGHTLTFEAKRVISTAAADISASSIGTSPAIVITNGAGGLAEIRLLATHTAWATAYGNRASVAMTFDLWDSATPEPIATGNLILRRLPQS